MKDMPSIDVAYLAGLIDGEGCLAVVRQRNSHCRGGYAYRCGLRVANTNQAIMEWLVSATGVGCIQSHTPKMRNSKPQWTWDIWGDDAADVTRLLLPSMRIKRAQADLLLAFQAALKQRSGPHLSDREIDFREACYQRSRTLNCRGAQPAIAKSYGGGGHRNASGIKMPIGWEGDSQ